MTHMNFVSSQRCRVVQCGKLTTSGVASRCRLLEGSWVTLRFSASCISFRIAAAEKGRYDAAAGLDGDAGLEGAMPLHACTHESFMALSASTAAHAKGSSVVRLGIAHVRTSTCSSTYNTSFDIQCYKGIVLSQLDIHTMLL